MAPRHGCQLRLTASPFTLDLDCSVVHQPILDPFLLFEAWEWRERLRAKVYKHLWRVNRAFEGVGRSLAVLAAHDAFDRRELERFRALVQDQAATNSYLAHALDWLESTEAGRLFRGRITREGRDNSDKD